MSVFIGIPTYSGEIHHSTVSGLFDTAYLCGKEKVSIAFTVMPHDAFIGRARNFLVHKFLETGLQDLVFIDADIGFSAIDLAKLCKATPPVVMGLYKMKCKETRYPALMMEPLERHSSDSDLIKLRYGPTGFMKINRQVFEVMKQKWPEEYYTYGEIGQVHDYFPHGRFGNWFIGEDIRFCDRLRECGFDIWAKQGIELKHYGEGEWASNWQIDVLEQAA